MPRRLGVLVAIVAFAMSASSANAIVVPINVPPGFSPFGTLHDLAARIIEDTEQIVASIERATGNLMPGPSPSYVAAAAAPVSEPTVAPSPPVNNPPLTPSTTTVTPTGQPIIAAAIMPSTQSSGDALSARLASLTGIVGNMLALLPSLENQEPQSNDVSVQSQIDALSHEIAQTNQVGNLSNVTIENPTLQGGISGLTAADIPALDYLSLTGGSLAGDLQLNGSATTTGSSYFAGNVGIGTSTTQDALSVNGSTYLADITPPTNTTNRLYSNGGALYWSGSVVASSLVGHWTSDGTNAWRVSGNVGIGTSSPFATLSVVGNGYFTGGLTAANASTTNLSVSGNSVLGSATSTSLFSPIADFTNGIISTLNASVANIVGFTATNATTTNLAITSLPSTLLSTNANGSVQSTTISSPLALSGSTLSIAQANGSQSGFLNSSDWTNFNGKLGSSTISSLSANYDPLWNGSAFVNGALYDTGSAIGIGTTSPSSTFAVNGSGYFSGTLTAPIADAGGQVFNVKAYGATGNGVTNDTAAIELAASSTPSGGTLFFPPGNYLISAPVSVPNIEILGSGQGSVITAAPHASWSGGITAAFWGASSVPENITVQNMTFQFPYGNSTYGGSYAHILAFSNGINLKFLNNTSDGGADFVALINDNAVLVQGNTVTNASNSCYDAWGGTTDLRVIDNYCTTLTNSGISEGAINFTPLAVGGVSSASTTGAIIQGNTIHMRETNNAAGDGQCIEINGYTSGPNYGGNVTVTGNQCYVDAGNSWGVIVGGLSNYGQITDNFFYGNQGTYSAVAVAYPATGWNVTGNVANDWQASPTNGVFYNAGITGALYGNRSYNSTSTAIGSISTTTVTTYDNDTGTGLFNLTQPLLIGYNGIQIMEITSTDHLLIGSTVDNASLYTSGTFRADGTATFVGALKGTNGSAGGPEYGFWTNTNGLGMYRVATDTLAFSTASTQRLQINAIGDVSIGTSSPSSLLTLWGPDTAAGTLPFHVVNNASTTLFNVTDAGNVGVGTSTPGSPLSLNNIANFTTATSTFYSTGGLNLAAGCFAVAGNCVGLGNISGTLAASQGGTGSTTLSGLLKGNGTGSVLTAVAGTDYQAPLSFTYPLQNTSNTVSEAWGTTTADTWSQLQTLTSGFIANASSTVVGNISSTGSGIFSGTTGTTSIASGQGFTIGGSQFVVQQGSGNVGIGTAAPNAPIVVSANVTPGSADPTYKGLVRIMQDASESSNGGLEFETSSFSSGYGWRILNPDDGGGVTPLVFQYRHSSASWTDLVTMNNGGLAVGTTTGYARLTVWGPDTASTSALSVVNNASTTEFTVLDNGNATLAGNLIQNSDQRLKTNIQPLDASSSLDAIDALNPVTFNWIDPAKSSVPQFGFIAQQVEQVFPNLVSTTSPTALTPDGTLSLNYIDLISPICRRSRNSTAS
jgi:trimeric autotransporter adhesin